MAAIRKIDKDSILDAAYNLVRKEGFGSLSARKLAKAASCSTQPIYENFNDMGMIIELTNKRVQEQVDSLKKSLKDRMVTQDKLIKYQSADGSSSMYRMEKADHSCHEHLHMQCVKCGKVIHIDRDTMNHIAKGVQERYGFTIDCDRSSICGICKDCQRRCGVAAV